MSPKDSLCGFLALISTITLVTYQAPPCLAKPQPQPATPSTISTLMLLQDNDIYGQARTYICNTGLRIELFSTNVAVVSKAPTWRVVFYNSVTKKGLSMSKDEWLHHLQHTTYSGRDWDRSTVALAKPYPVARFGRKARRYRVAGNFAGKGFAPNPKLPNAEYTELDAPKIPLDALRIMSKCLSTPRSTGIPINMLNHLPDVKTVAFRSISSGDQTYLRTLKVEDKQMPASIFDYPKDITAEKSEADVMNDAQKKQRVHDAFEVFLP